MKKKEIKLIKDLYNHFQPQTDVTDELINSCYNQYGSIRGVLMNLILKFQPNVDITDEYLDKKLSDYGLLIAEENKIIVEKDVVKVEEVTPVAEESPYTEDIPKEENSKFEVVKSPKNKKNNVLKRVIIILVFLGLAYFGTNLYFQNQLLQSSLEETKDLYQQELNTNYEEILMEIDEEDPANEGHWSLSHKTYANSNASNLNVRSTPAISDNIIDMLQLGDRVEVLDTIRIEIKTIKQALLNQETFIEIEGIEILFQKGKALEIVNKIGDNSYRVIVDERNNEAIISKKNLDLIDKEIWLKIRLNNQQEGYVYQRFLTSEISDDEEMSITEYKSYIKINDPDGYTNVRSGKSSSTEIIHQIYDENKLFELIDDSGNWWEIKLDSEEDEITTGFIHNSQVLQVESFTVVVDKAYFYLKANDGFQNRAYLIQDDQLFCHSNIENNFRNCTYINSKGDTTIGYIKMNQLKRR